jgi:hypothetical protein
MSQARISDTVQVVPDLLVRIQRHPQGVDSSVVSVLAPKPVASAGRSPWLCINGCTTTLPGMFGTLDQCTRR